MSEASRIVFGRDGLIYMSISGPGSGPDVDRAQKPGDYAGKVVRLRDGRDHWSRQAPAIEQSSAEHRAIESERGKLPRREIASLAPRPVEKRQIGIA